LNNVKDLLIERKIDESWVKMNLRKTSNFIEFTLEDNGAVIPEGIISKIFGA
jgi:sensor histidine kinase regulating citrate/malate metabolism